MKQSNKQEPTTWSCPGCGRTDSILELNTVLVEYQVISFDARGNPSEWGDSEVFWDTAETVKGRTAQYAGGTYRCNACNLAFNRPTQVKLAAELVPDAT